MSSLWNWLWKLSWIGAFSLAVLQILALTISQQANAQITPDTTLGAESSVVTPNEVIRGWMSDRIGQELKVIRIDGGAIRGANLFHSFQEFNVEEGRGVYFANPQGIENILSRVTGTNRSEILGRLGVLGNANLFLINPNGIVFGQNASLDVEGSFVATTAEAIALGEQGDFSATQPQQSSLLSVSPGALFFNQAAAQPGNIIHAGNLSAGKDLTLAARNLELQGQLYAGENLTLQATDTLRIRDSVTNPFVAAARGQVLVQGNQGVDIFALNHPESGLFSGGNMILRSANTVGGDARYWSGDSFRIEQLDGSLGNLFSPNDPIIRSRGDVSFNSYYGTSLHILAAGSVTIPGVVAITGAETGTSGVDFIAENFTLSNGTELPIDGRARPTFDVRAGVDPSAIGNFGNTGVNADFFFNISSNIFSLFSSISRTPTISNTATSADINIGGIAMLGSNAANGLVFLSNQYKPNLSLPRGNIEVGTIVTADTQSLAQLEERLPAILRNFLTNGFNGNGGDVIIDSRSSIGLNGTRIANFDINAGSFIYTSSATGEAGNITLLAKENIFLATGSGVVSETRGSERGGKVTVTASEKLELVGPNTLLGTSTQSDAPNGGRGGDVEINTKELILRERAYIGSASGVSSTGDVGNVTLNATESIQLLEGGGVNSNTNGSGRAGNITINTQRLIAQQGNSKEGSGVSASSLSTLNNAGVGGNLIVKASESVQLIGNRPGVVDDLTSTTEIANLLIESTVNLPGDGVPLISGLITVTSGPGNAGDLIVDTKQLLIQDGAGIATATVGSNIEKAGKGGNLTVKADDSITLSGVGGLASATLGTGNAGNLSLTTKELLTQNGAAISSETRAAGEAGTLTIDAERLRVLSAGQIRAGTTGSGQGKTITITADNVELAGVSKKLISSSLTTETTGEGTAGNLIINARNLSINNGARISAATSNQGQGGSITVTAPESVTLSGNTQLSVEASGAGKAGDVTINTNLLTVEKQAAINATSTASATTSQQGGSIALNASNINLFGTPGILAETQGEVPAGTLTIQPYNNGQSLNVNFAQDARISASTRGSGQGGSLIVKAPEAVTLSGNGQLTVETSGAGAAGDVKINTQNLTIQENAKVSASTTSTGQGGNINIQSNSVTLNKGEISARTQGQGNGGQINIDVDELLRVTDSDIVTAAIQSSGGAIAIAAKDIRLFGDSDITTNVGSGAGGGGNITLTANSIIAFDDSDLLAFARDGKGGDIALKTPAFFGNGYNPVLTDRDLSTLDGNQRVDINASGAVSGNISIPDTSFIQGSLSELPENPIDTGSLIANSCIARNPSQQEGTFIITGSGSLPSGPGDALMSLYTFGTVRSVSNVSPSTNSTHRPWQKGDPIVEPQGVYRLPSGQLILSRECSL
ncbi:hypothetical protein WA1_06055 [Scytonema hofmannii PCC 7110]|uniref:Filamentous haemagglutinin FhaB/tRNA nuclease CdiA-like TPS domain-containing protein n=1 Tax=Scytonema hofmannii PCC 7110 TaxID=128403 RepID=A0A139WSH5_9CYAN|nr:filamentous hemagglutinin N-terminal domain-containing protein [Scytonema hofmannii]KYC35386.1 hypothetical protein WA1_06055 [Scytonema hofmannii PCC 7110]